MDVAKLKQFVDKRWDESIIESLSEYIRIPNKSPAFDADWQANGHMQKAMALLDTWTRQQSIQGMTVDLVELPQRTPLLYIEIEGSTEHTLLFYGHMDKQPEMEGWADDLSPWEPVIKNDKLYGRGGADDGYSLYASLTAIAALQEQQLPHARCVILIEASEESGSYDLPAYIDHLQDRIGEPELVIGLDSGCGDYERLWGTTSLRGMISGVLRVDVLNEGVHSGLAGGIVPSSFRMARQLLSRIEDAVTGEVLLPALQVNIPKERIAESADVAELLASDIVDTYPWVVSPTPSTYDELLLNKNWRASIATTGVDGMPSIADGGNVLRPYTALKLAVRIPPTCDPENAAMAIKKELERDPPPGCQASFTIQEKAHGWHSPVISDWLRKAIDDASNKFYGHAAAYMGEGGTIPFMGMLGEKFPKAEFLITGVLGPQSNAHGPNEFLHIPFAKKLTCAVADIVYSHYQKIVG